MKTLNPNPNVISSNHWGSVTDCDTNPAGHTGPGGCKWLGRCPGDVQKCKSTNRTVRTALSEQTSPPRAERLTTSRSKKQTDWTARQHSDITRRAAWDVVIWGWRKPQFQVLCYLLSINNMTEVNFSISLWPTSCITWIKHLVVTGQQDAHTNIHHVYRP